jgi:hypothetical protein
VEFEGVEKSKKKKKKNKTSTSLSLTKNLLQNDFNVLEIFNLSIPQGHQN